MTANLTYSDPTITGHVTPGGKLAVKATSGDLSTTKYVVGGYWYYVISARVASTRWDPKERDIVREPNVEIGVHKRTNNRDTALREARRWGTVAYRVTKRGAGDAESGKLIPIGAAL